MSKLDAVMHTVDCTQCITVVITFTLSFGLSFVTSDFYTYLCAFFSTKCITFEDSIELSFNDAICSSLGIP